MKAIGQVQVEEAHQGHPWNGSELEVVLSDFLTLPPQQTKRAMIYDPGL